MSEGVKTAEEKAAEARRGPGHRRMGGPPHMAMGMPGEKSISFVPSAKRLFGLLGPHRAQLMAILAFMVASVVAGAVGPKMLELVGVTADGMHTHPTNTSSRYLREVILPRVAAGATRRSPALAPPLLCANELVACGPDDATVAAERERFRAMLAFLFSTPAYWPSLELFGWRDVGERLLRLTREGRWKEMANALPDAVLDEFLVSGRYEELPEALVTRFGGLVRRITLPVPSQPAHDAAHAAAIAAIRARGAA
jgi:hypothetical protein